MTVLGGYWESSYRTGDVPWDPGPYDRHVPRVLRDHAVAPCNALDIGCGEGKSAVWLARQGFSVLGIDISPTAIETAQSIARSSSGRGVQSERAGSGEVHFVTGSFPEDLSEPARRMGAGDGFGFIMERGLLQHMTTSERNRAFLETVVRWLLPAGIFYSLIAKSEGAHRFGGPPTWSEKEVRAAFRSVLEIVELRGDVFTPGEAGSIPAWVVVARRR
ncbi:MAG: class I SAM-dependent methyltransferase [Spirochaetaceae bacterium]